MNALDIHAVEDYALGPIVGLLFAVLWLAPFYVIGSLKTSMFFPGVAYAGSAVLFVGFTVWLSRTMYHERKGVRVND